MRVYSTTTKAELKEIVERIDLDVDVLQNVITQLRRLEGYSNGLSAKDRRVRVLRAAKDWLGLSS